LTSPSARSPQIFAEQVRTLYAQLPVSVPTQIVGGALLVAAMWSHVSRTTLVAWFAVACVNQLARIALYRAWRRRLQPDADLRRWRFWWACGAGVSGLIWGAAGVVMFVPDSPAHQAVLIVALLGVATGSITVIATDVMAFYVFAGAVVTPVLLRTAWQGETYAVLAAIGVVVLVAILGCGHNLSKELARSLAVYYQNLGLIEELKAQKAIAERARHEAETANRAKTQFFASASHDLRQPLHAMGLFAAALSEKTHDPEVRHVVDSINSSVHALEALFSELLDIAKIDSGAMQPVLAPFALAEMFGRLQSDFEAEAAAKGLKLAVEGGAHVVTSDALLLERIIRNLLSNAIRYTAEGAVRLTAVSTGDRIQIEVADTGIGIREEDRQRIFEEFIQLGNPARTSVKGMGLGLSIVQRLCGLLGYELAVDSVYGGGSTFGFVVPGGLAPKVPREEHARAKDHADLSGRLVVAIDDEAAIVEGMRVLLAGWGAEVISSLTGDDVIEAVHAAGRMPDIIIADYRLGSGATGTEVVERLRRELDPEIPAIMVSGSTAPDLVSAARASRCELLLKPVQPEKLRELIDATLTPRGLRRP
jgi:signal transduction histidine kinase/CheY-like chemotaxis protein